MNDINELEKKLEDSIIETIRRIGTYSLVSLSTHPDVSPLAYGNNEFFGIGRNGKKAPLLVKGVNMLFIKTIERLVSEAIIELHACPKDPLCFVGEDVYQSEDWLPIEVKWGKNFPK